MKIRLVTPYGENAENWMALLQGKVISLFICIFP